MFDTLARGSDAELIDAMGAAARAESAAIARRLAAVGELYARRSAELAGSGLWCADPFEAVAAEVSAAQNIGRGRAGSQIRYARELREHLPLVAAVFANGDIDFRMVTTIINRTATVDSAVIADVDTALARLTPRWTKLSVPKLIDRIDQWIAKFDADGVRVPPQTGDSCFVNVTPSGPGLGEIWARIHATDAAAFDQRLDALAATVCKNDPRSSQQLRGEAVGALAAGADRMACQCGSADCPMAAAAAVPQVVIHLLAEQSTVDGTSNNPGYLAKFGIQPADAVRGLASRADCRPLSRPGAEPAPGYRPPVALAEFIRWRDLTCRWPGCDAPAERCDIDHTVPYADGGPTHAANLKNYCRTHHLIKTFYCGPGGWTEQQCADGAIILTSPTGHQYMTQPGGAALFPVLGTPIGVPPAIVDPEPPQTGRSLAMPTRRRTRDEDRRLRRDKERRQRAAINAALAHERALRIAADQAANPPPF